MDRELETARYRTGTANSYKCERGMLIQLGVPVQSLMSGDTLIIKMQAGNELNMEVDGEHDGRIDVFTLGAMNLRFWLVPVGPNTLRLDMEDHHVEILRRSYPF